MRKLLSVIATAGLLVSLSACTNGPFASGCTPTFSSGDNAALVTAEGAFGKDPKADFPTPLIVKKTEVAVVSEGKDDLVKSGDTVDVQISIYDGKTGEFLIATDRESAGLRQFAVEGLPAFGTVAECVTVGSRVAAVGPAGEILGEESITSNNLPVGADDTVVLVVDVTRSFLGKANGADVLFPASGFPAVVLAPNGRPGITVPNADAPTELMIANLKSGSGATVKKGDSVVVNYTGVLWDGTEPFDSSWERGVPATFVAESLDDSSTGLVPGFAQALIGQKVGSQVIVVIPPEFGYPAGSAPASIPEGSTMIFVFDVLGIE